MSYHKKQAEQPSFGKWNGFDHLTFYVSNAKQVVDFYCLRFGFKRIAYKGLETGSREQATHVVRQNNVTLVFVNDLNPVTSELTDLVALRGDFVRDVAFQCGDVEATYAAAIERGAVSVKAPETIKDKDGSVIMATIHAYGATTHTFVQRDAFKGLFLPGFEPVTTVDPVLANLAAPDVKFIDHIVCNQQDQKMNDQVDWYVKTLGFHRFWSVDDDVMHTEYSALRSTVVSDWGETIKLPINEPAKGKRKSQIQEYVDYHGGPGVQHVALRSVDIISTVRALRSRGVDFLKIPSAYYSDLAKRLAKSPCNVVEDLKVLEELGILVDFDDNGYLLQLFTKPVEDRPTLFYEVIERHNHQGFGAGNFKSLFEAIERDQDDRGNLTTEEDEKRPAKRARTN